jgi:L-ascorbate metabolism protein UlaG (beta-lactamase superfamily)
MSPVHIDPDEAIAAHHDLRATTSLGIHHWTFNQADDGFDEPAGRIRAAVDRGAVSGQAFWVPRPGEARVVPPVATATASVHVGGWSSPPPRCGE